MIRAGWLLIAAALTSAPGRAEAPCAMAATDAAWIGKALGNWRIAERELLKLAPQPLPSIFAIDARCTYSGRADADGRITWSGSVHGGTLRFPDGKTQPAGPLAFAAPDPKQSSGGYFAIGLPSVWRAANVTSVLGLEKLMDGVMLHELMHTRQFYFVNPRLAALDRKYHLGDAIGDDSLQARFKGDPAYVAAYQAERDALFAAAAAPDDAEARRLARVALKLMRDRRSRWFRGAEAKWAALDEVFLTMEGLGQWLAYAWLRSPRGGVADGVDILRAVRRDGRYWTQDEGLALFLTVDRLVPDWQRQAFAAKPELAETLLARAAR